MNQNSFKEVTKAMAKLQSPKRFNHTLGVSYTAACLAMRYGENMENARMAGLLHDCAKSYSDDKQLKLCEKYHISITEVEQRNPFLLHGKLGCYLAAEKYGIENKDILNAIENHTTGRPEMSLLEKIVFVSDYIEPNRKDAPNLQSLRELAFIDLEEALYNILEQTLKYLEKNGRDIDPKTRITYEYYETIRKERKHEGIS